MAVATVLFGLLAVTKQRVERRSVARSVTPAVAPAGYNWNGLYLGLNAGYGIRRPTRQPLQGAASSAAASANVPGFIGGAQIGVNYQIGAVVWGFEADFDASTQNQSLASGVLVGHQPDAVVWNAARPIGRRLRPAPRLCDGGRRSRRAEVQFHNAAPALPARPSPTAPGRPAAASNTASPIISARASNTFTSTPAMSTRAQSALRPLRSPAA